MSDDCKPCLLQYELRGPGGMVPYMPMQDVFENFGIVRDFNLDVYWIGWAESVRHNLKYIYRPCWNADVFMEDEKVLSIVVSPAYQRNTYDYWNDPTYLSCRWKPLISAFDKNLFRLDDILPKQLAKYERELPYDRFIHVKPMIYD